MLTGTTVCPGVAVGPALVRDDELERVAGQRVSAGRVNEELNRFREALDAARQQLQDLKSKLESKISAHDARIFDTHLAYLKDPVFITDVERLVLDEQMKLESAIAKVINDFDRVFKLVESQMLRERALDLRDVGIRVLRCLRPGEGDAPPPPPTLPGRYVLCARDLSTVDMFSLGSERVDAIVTEELALTSHAAILARSLRIPTIMGAKGLLKNVKNGDILLIDASGGQIHINPDERILGEYPLSRENSEEIEPWIKEPTRTRDGTSVVVFATGGNHDDVEKAVASRMDGVGLYRCELLYLFDKKPVEEDSLEKHFARALEIAKGAPVTFRLLDVDSRAKVEGISNLDNYRNDANPALGSKSLRALLKHPELLRPLVRAILRAGVAGNARIVIPFVMDASDVRRVKEIIFDEKQALRKEKIPHAQQLPLGAMIEIPAAAFGVKDLIEEIDFFVIALDSLVQYSLAVDRENEDLRGYFQFVHPLVLRLVRDVVAAADATDREITIHGEMVSNPENIRLLLGAGARRFGVPPMAYAQVKRAIRDVEVRDARKRAADAMRCSTLSELEQIILGYRG